MVTVNAAFDQHLKERSEATRNFLTLNKQRLAGSGAGTKGGAGTAYGVSAETEGDVGDLLAGTGAGGAGDTLSPPAPVFMYSGACGARFPCCPHFLSPLFFFCPLLSHPLCAHPRPAFLLHDLCSWSRRVSSSSAVFAVEVAVLDIVVGWVLCWFVFPYCTCVMVCSLCPSVAVCCCCLGAFHCLLLHGS